MAKTGLKTIGTVAALTWVLTACGDGSSPPTVEAGIRRATVSTRSSVPVSAQESSTTSSPSPVPVDEPGTSTSDAAGCDAAKVMEAIRSSGAAGGDGHIGFLRCLDGFGWAEYAPIGADPGHVLFAVQPDHYDVLSLGTSVCPRDAGVPDEIAQAIAPTPEAIDDCPPTSDARVTEGGHQPWRDACIDDPEAYAGCEPDCPGGQGLDAHAPDNGCQPCENLDIGTWTTGVGCPPHGS